MKHCKAAFCSGFYQKHGLFEPQPIPWPFLKDVLLAVRNMDHVGPLTNVLPVLPPL